jgi:hypothetical protein
MESKIVKFLLAVIALALLLNAAVNFKPYVFVPTERVPDAQGLKMNVYTGKISPVFLDIQETKKLLQEYRDTKRNLTPNQ